MLTIFPFKTFFSQSIGFYGAHGPQLAILHFASCGLQSEPSDFWDLYLGVSQNGAIRLPQKNHGFTKIVETIFFLYHWVPYFEKHLYVSLHVFNGQLIGRRGLFMFCLTILTGFPVSSGNQTWPAGKSPN